jgi:hypothetical protein
MQSARQIPAVWVYTSTATYNGFRPQGYGAMLSPDQQARLERIRQGRLLYQGRHREYFLDEDRTQFDFAPVRVGDRTIQPYSTFNLLGLVSNKSADLLFGEAPLLRCTNPVQSTFLAELVERSNLHQLFYTAALDASYEGEAFIEACIQDGEVYLTSVPADEIFPVGTLRADGQYPAYDRMRIADIGSATKIIILLRERYLPGRIDRQVFQLDGDLKMSRRVSLSVWPEQAGQPPLEEVTETGCAFNTMTWIPNQLSRRAPVSDYDGSIDLQDSLNAKNTQIHTVLAKHANPKLYAPIDSADDQGQLRAGAEVYFGRSKEDCPTYITWNGELSAAMQDRDFIMHALLMRVEMSPILLGIQTAVSKAQSFKAIKVQTYNSSARAQRRASYWKAGIKRAIQVAQQLEQTLPGVRYDVTPIAVELRDGLPIDDLDQANRQAILRSCNMMSQKRGLMEQLQDPQAVAEELAELAKEAAKNAPSIFGEEASDVTTDAGDGAGADNDDDTDSGYRRLPNDPSSPDAAEQSPDPDPITRVGGGDTDYDGMNT